MIDTTPLWEEPWLERVGVKMSGMVCKRWLWQVPKEGKEERETKKEKIGTIWYVISCLYILQIPNQLHFFTKIGDFLHGRCKKSLLDVKNLPVALSLSIPVWNRADTATLALVTPPSLLPSVYPAPTRASSNGHKPTPSGSRPKQMRRSHFSSSEYNYFVWEIT